MNRSVVNVGLLCHRSRIVSQTKTICWAIAVFCPLTLMVQLSNANALLEEYFSTDVIGSGNWTASDASVYVDVSNGWLHIASDGDWDDAASKFVSLTLPIVVEARMRLVSGGYNYTLPGIGLYSGPPFSGANFITYLPGENYGWKLYEWTNVHTMGPQNENEWMTIKAIIRVDGGELLVKSDMDAEFTSTLTRNWSIPSEIVNLVLVQNWDAVCDFDYVRVTALPPPTGDICGTVTLIDGSPVSGVIVKVIDSANNQVGDPQVTGADGGYHFTDIANETYSVMMVMPLGYAVAPSETQTGIQPATPCTEVDFMLTPTIVANNCRSVGYWKHQFDVYLTGRGCAQETAADLEAYLDVVCAHFDELGVYTGLETFTFQDAKDILTIWLWRPMLERAKKQMFALLLNFASGRIGNETVVSHDGRVAAEAVTYAAQLINDGDLRNDATARNICALINVGLKVCSGIIPESAIRYKVSPWTKLPNRFMLEQNYPNPFNQVTTIEYNVPSSAQVTIEIFNMLGQKVRTLVNENKSAGTYRIEWNGNDETGQSASTGVYLYRFSAGDIVQTKKMLLLK